MAVFDTVRAQLSDRRFVAQLVHEYPRAGDRDAALTELWGASEEAAIARRQFAWDAIAKPTATREELAIVGANADIPVDVLLGHPSADHELVGLIFDRMKYRETRPPKWERTYWYWVNRSHR